MENGSPFSQVPRDEWIASNALAFAFLDRFPQTPGHSLVVTRRIVPTWLDATPAERVAVMELVDRVVDWLEKEHRPDGLHIGTNVGEAAGQSVFHVHMHVIPRYRDDGGPTNGVRGVLPWAGR
jgi:diadenosine tetraphosphate (Ap4A) HIT family hydrolase